MCYVEYYGTSTWMGKALSLVLFDSVSNLGNYLVTERSKALFYPAQVMKTFCICEYYPTHGMNIPSSDPERVQEIVAICNAGEPAELRIHLASKLPAWQSVRHWWITADLKPNVRGKLSRAEWKERWQKKR